MDIKFFKSFVGVVVFTFTIGMYWWAAVATSQPTDYVDLNAYVDTLGTDSIIVTNNDSFDYVDWDITATPSTQVDSSYYRSPLVLLAGEQDTLYLGDFNNYWNSIYPAGVSPSAIRLSVYIPAETQTIGSYSREF